MQKNEVIEILIKNFNFSKESIYKLEKFHLLLKQYNKKFNLIAKSTENDIWTRHILDSGQLVQFIDPKKGKNIVDFGSGAGFPGIVLSIFDVLGNFHVKLYEKSRVKRSFLHKIKEELLLNFKIENNVYSKVVQGDYIFCRAFKKLDKILMISRETIKKPHKLIVLKGRNAQNEINKVSLEKKYSYTIKNSVTEKESKIIIFDVQK